MPRECVGSIVEFDIMMIIGGLLLSMRNHWGSQSFITRRDIDKGESRGITGGQRSGEAVSVARRNLNKRSQPAQLAPDRSTHYI